MRFAIFLLAFLSSFQIMADELDLNKELEAQILSASKHWEESIADIKEYGTEKELEVEYEIRDAYLELLQYAIESDNETLKKIILKYEYNIEISDLIYEMSYEENLATTLANKAKMAVFRNKLEQIKE